MRTSPTNIGLWMLSALAAHDFGYLTGDEVVEKLTNSMETIGKLERYEGHLLNWYDLQTLTPLEPRYVSAVDSGNLLGALWTMEHGLDELMQTPVLDAKAFAGLRDTAEILSQVVEQEGISGLDAHSLVKLLLTWEAAPADRIADALRLLRRVEGSVRALADEARGSAGLDAAAVYWTQQMEKQVSAWLGTADRYLTWIKILDEKTEEEVAVLGPEAVLAFRQDLGDAPSLLNLANGHIRSIQILQSIRDAPPAAAGSPDRMARPPYAVLRKIAMAGRRSARFGKAAHREGARAYPNRSTCVSCMTPNDGCFPSATTSRKDTWIAPATTSWRVRHDFGSFIAIARGEVPMEHWFSMGRPYGEIGRRRVLLSWAGTMFEYLMPLIFQRSQGYTLLDEATRGAVAIHMAYGRRQRLPWGISESAFGDLDLNKTYQYKAFGVPELGLKRGLEEQSWWRPMPPFSRSTWRRERPCRI